MIVDVTAGNDHLIQRNAIHHVNMQASDMGAIDLSGQWINRGIIIRNNLLFAIGNHAEGACNSYWTVGNCSASGCGYTGPPVPANCSAHHVYVDWTQPQCVIEGNIFYQPTPTNVFLDGGVS